MYIAQNKIKKLSFGTIRNKWLEIKLSSVKFVAKSREIGMMRGVNDCFQLDISRFNKYLEIDGFHCRHAGGQNKRKFVHIVCIIMAVNSQRRKMLLFLSTNMAAMTPHENHQ